MNSVVSVLCQIFNATICVVVSIFVLLAILGCLVAVANGLARMGTSVRRTGGSAALAGVVGLALVCILLAQKSPVPGCRGPRSAPAQPLSEPHGCAADSLPELPALTSPFTPPDGDGLRLTGISLTPTSVVLGAGWPAGLLAPGEPLDVLYRARLEDGFWRPLAWTRPPASATGLAVEVPSALLPGGAGAASFFALARSALRDTDGDGLPDAWESAHGLDPASGDGRDGADGDPDGDGLPNLGEYRLGADPLAPDTDGDGLADGEEAGGIWLDALDRMVHPSPALADTDGDGVADGDEVDAGSDPELADSDSDGMPDAEELGAVSVLRGGAFAWPDLSGGVDLLAGATGVVRERVWTFGLAWPVVFGGRTFTRVCVDLSGALHLLQSGDPAPAAPLAGGDDLRWPSPWDRDLPADALVVAACWCWDGLALDPSAGSALRVYDDASAHATVVEFRHAMRGAWGDGRDDWATFRVVLSADADDVARIDVLEASDGFLDAAGGTVGVLDLSRGSYRDPDWFCHVQYASYLRPAPLEPRTSVVLRLGTGTDPSRADTDGDGLGDRAEIREHGTDPVRADTDGDLLPDGWELGSGLDPFVPDGDDGRDGDPDGDGLPNRGEFLAGSDPRNRHSDTDGLPDGEECGGIVETNALPWLAFDAGSAADLTPVLAGEWDRVADWALPVPLALPGGTCTNAVLDSSGAVYLMRAGVASPTSPPPVRDLGEEVALRDALVLAPAWGALWTDADAAEPTRVRAGTATHGGEAYVLFEFERARCGSAWEGGALSFQVAVPAACADRAYVRYRDVAGDAADGRFAVVGLQGLDGRTRASWCAWEEGRVRDGLQLLFLFGQGSDPVLDDTDGDGLRDDAERTAGTDPADPDTDGDGLPDGWEAAYSACGFDPRVDNARDGVRDTDPDADPDGDGLTNAEEAMWGTNPSGRDDDRDGRPDGADTDGDGVEDGAEVRQSSDPADASDGGLPGSRAKVVFRFGDYSGSESERYRLELACVEGGGPDVVRAGVLGRVVPAEAMLKPGCAYEARLRHAGTAPQYRGVPGFPDYDYELELASAPPNVLLEDPQGLFGRIGAGPYDPFLAEGKTARLVVLPSPTVSGPRYVGVNDDDDNGDGIRDSLNDRAVAGEDDLAEIRVSMRNPCGVSGTMRLTLYSVATETTLWKDRSKRDFVAVGESFPVDGTDVERTYYLEGLKESIGYGTSFLRVEFLAGDAVAETSYRFSVIRRIVDPLTLDEVGGALVNPCCASVGSRVHMKVDVLPSGFPEDLLRWEVVSGAGTLGNGGKGHVVPFTPGAGGADVLLRVHFGDAPGEVPVFRMKVFDGMSIGNGGRE